uniref:Uncharacterized protein n=1 Tax=Acrobeloides nanus TaxID=290746 RepID=A0A914BWS5_9BILA
MNELEGGGYTNPHDGWMNDYKGGRSEDECLLDNIKPCHALNNFEKLEHARYAQHYKAEAWVRQSKI